MAWTDYLLPSLEGAGAIGLVAATGGTALPAAIPLATGSIAGFSGIANKNAADKLMPPLSDPNVTKFMNTIDTQRQAFNTGSQYNTEKNELRNMQSATNEGILKVAGGNTGAAINAMQRAGLNTGLAYGKFAGQMEERGLQQQDFYTQLLASFINNNADRAFDIQRSQWEQNQLDARSKQAFSYQTALNSLTMMGKIPNLFGGGSGINTNTPSITSPSPMTPPSSTPFGSQNYPVTTDDPLSQKAPITRDIYQNAMQQLNANLVDPEDIEPTTGMQYGNIIGMFNMQ